MREAFDLFDLDRDGKITAVELCRVMNALRLENTENEIREMITRADIDGNGTVEFNEFIDMMARRATQLEAAAQAAASTAESADVARQERQEAEIRQAFRVFDIDGDGLIDANELRQTMANLGENLSDADVRAMIREADKNGDGKVDFDEFVQMILTK